MTNRQRMKSDIATMDRRYIEDQTTKDNQNKNDKLTVERRSKAAKTLSNKRIRNDELTVERRSKKDESLSLPFLVFLFTLAVLGAGVYFILI